MLAIEIRKMRHPSSLLGKRFFRENIKRQHRINPCRAPSRMIVLKITWKFMNGKSIQVTNSFFAIHAFHPAVRKSSIKNFVVLATIQNRKPSILLNHFYDQETILIFPISNIISLFMQKSRSKQYYTSNNYINF